MSWNPGEFDESAGGNIWQGGEAIIRNPRFVRRSKQDYRQPAGEGIEGVTLFAYDAEHLNGEGEPTTEEMLYAMGNGYTPTETYQGDPSEEGPFTLGPKYKKSSNFAIFVESLFNAGYAEDVQVDTPISVLENTKVNLARVPQPKRDGLEVNPAPGKKVYPKMFYLVTELLDAVSWEKKAPVKGKAAPAAKPVAKTTAKAAPAAAAGVVDDETKGEILKLALAANPKGIAKAKLASAVYKVVESTPDYKHLMSDRATLAREMNAPTFLNGSAEWSFDASTGLITASE